MDVKESIGELYVKCYGRMCGYVSKKFSLPRCSAEDLVQEAFAVAVEKSSTFDPEQGKLENWVFSIVRNTAIGQYRKDKIRAKYNRDNYNEKRDIMGTSISDEELTVLKDLSSKVLEDLEETGDKLTKKIIGLWLEGASERAIARKLKITRYEVKEEVECALVRWKRKYS